MEKFRRLTVGEDTCVQFIQSDVTALNNIDLSGFDPDTVRKMLTGGVVVAVVELNANLSTGIEISEEKKDENIVENNCVNSRTNVETDNNNVISSKIIQSPSTKENQDEKEELEVKQENFLIESGIKCEVQIDEADTFMSHSEKEVSDSFPNNEQQFCDPVMKTFNPKRKRHKSSSNEQLLPPQNDKGRRKTPIVSGNTVPDKIFMCSLEGCRFVTGKAKYLRRHQLVRHKTKTGRRGERNFCTQCQILFESHDKFVTHEDQFHQRDRPSKCNVCDRRFRTRSYLNIHIKGVHNEGAKCFSCSFAGCDYASNYKSAILKHQRFHRPLPTATKTITASSSHQNARKDSLTSPIPTETKTITASSSSHQNTGKDPFTCPIPNCGNSFKILDNLNDHMKLSHPTHQPWNCPDCGERFALKFYRTIHHQTVHQKRSNQNVDGHQLKKFLSEQQKQQQQTIKEEKEEGTEEMALLGL